MHKILIIDDDESNRETLSLTFSEMNYQTLTANCGKAGVELAKKEKPDIVITDLQMPDINGIEVLKAIKSFDDTIPVIMITAFGDMNTTITATQEGAYDYITKPIDINHLTLIVKRTIDNVRLSRKLESIAYDENIEYRLSNTLVGKAKSMQEIYKNIGKASANRVTVLIQGESGTGKELIAKIIHTSGITKEYPFVAINCTALPENLLESELFGHVKGSFTDAVKDKKGKFELAGEGTIFLDEISEMTFNLQAKLLRVLQEHEFERVGGENTIPMRARVIAATNSDLQKLVAQEKFREDLYYRLSVFTINPPPLRERREDIEPLVKHFLEKINLMLHKNVRKIPDDVMQMIKQHDWNGNVRELENTLMQAIVLSKGDMLEKEAVLLRRAETKTSGKSVGENVSIEDLEKRHIKMILEKTGWDIRESCEILGISKATIYRKIETYKLKQPSK